MGRVSSSDIKKEDMIDLYKSLHVEEYYARKLVNFRNSKFVEDPIELEKQLKHYLSLASIYLKYGFHGHVKMTIDAARKYLKIEHLDTN